MLDSGIQAEDAAKVFEKGWNLTNFKYDNSASEYLKKCQDIMNKYNIKYEKNDEKEKVEKGLDDIKERLDQIVDNIETKEKQIADIENELENNKNKISVINDTKDLDVDLSELYNLEYVRFRYGKISADNIDRLENSLKEQNTIISRISTDEKGYIWIICVTSKENSAKVDSYLNLFKFERFYLKDGIDGNPKEMWEKIEKEIEGLEFSLDKQKYERSNYISDVSEEIIDIYRELKLYIKINVVKKFMAYDENGLFYIIGWIPATELNTILPKLSKERDVKYVVKNHDEVASTPPTKLRNNRLFRPFETLVRMYGLPNYTEHDPTSFVAITAFLIFGFMFGDVGQGLVIFLIGLYLARKKIEFGPIFEAGGIASIIFGFLYGSVFGSEEILRPIFISPMENIQTMLIYGIAIGVILIILSMTLNIRNGIKNDDKKKIFFDTNGVAGLLFYSLIVGTAGYYLLKGKMMASFGILSIILVIPLLAIMFKDALSEKIFKQKSEEKTSLVEKIFEVIEILLSFASNTISFVRVAAFAINHVGLCMAVYILSEMFSGTGSMVVKIIGNIVVIVLEGLIVAIQVLRLEYYELFSRFYTGDGKEYKPLREKI